MFLVSLHCAKIELRPNEIWNGIEQSVSLGCQFILPSLTKPCEGGTCFGVLIYSGLLQHLITFYRAVINKTLKTIGDLDFRAVGL